MKSSLCPLRPEETVEAISSTGSGAVTLLVLPHDPAVPTGSSPDYSDMIKISRSWADGRQCHPEAEVQGNDSLSLPRH